MAAFKKENNANNILSTPKKSYLILKLSDVALLRRWKKVLITLLCQLIELLYNKSQKSNVLKNGEIYFKIIPQDFQSMFGLFSTFLMIIFLCQLI